MPNFLDLPLEMRHQIYTYLVVLPPLPNPHELSILGNAKLHNKYNWHEFHTPASVPSLLHLAILSVSRQIYREAFSVLYGRNTFTVHHFLFATHTRLYDPCPHITTIPQHSPSHSRRHHQFRCPGQRRSWRYFDKRNHAGVPLIRRWHLPIRIEHRPLWDAADLTRAVAGAQLLTVELLSGHGNHPDRPHFVGGDKDPLLPVLEGVRGVRRVRIRWCAGRQDDRPVERYLRWLEGVMSSPVGTVIAPYVDAGEVAGDGVL